ncbi:hypothetical protein GQ43DRAFT_291796 [Delitschia confertaspora ATCC 74209]|uniref:Uncharacterized protein n=1 Tax=Delitschia confertaspora ATCC 74209 TaxID=1513339 RepID=A0A9P4JET1_9PLEO|nr:hypothetical protein GQ43DRAFT_291796 [Delitschia confertaspora ATCC 74209]
MQFHNLVNIFSSSSLWLPGTHPQPPQLARSVLRMSWMTPRRATQSKRSASGCPPPPLNRTWKPCGSSKRARNTFLRLPAGPVQSLLPPFFHPSRARTRPARIGHPLAPATCPGRHLSSLRLPASRHPTTRPQSSPGSRPGWFLGSTPLRRPPSPLHRPSRLSPRPASPSDLSHNLSLSRSNGSLIMNMHIKVHSVSAPCCRLFSYFLLSFVLYLLVYWHGIRHKALGPLFSCHHALGRHTRGVTSKGYHIRRC